MEAMSYIPRSSVAPQGAPGAIPQLVQKKQTFRLFGFIAMLMLVAAVAGSAGVYLYEIYLGNKLADAQQVLAANALQSDTVSENIAELELFEQKLETAALLLDDHIAPSKIFAALENVTKGSVQLSAFKYSYDPGVQALVEFSGETRVLPSVAEQNLELMKNTLFNEFVIEEVAIEPENETTPAAVRFVASGELRKELFRYTAPAVPETVTPAASVSSPEVGASATTTATTTGAATVDLIGGEVTQ